MAGAAGAGRAGVVGRVVAEPGTVEPGGIELPPGEGVEVVGPPPGAVELGAVDPGLEPGVLISGRVDGGS